MLQSSKIRSCRQWVNRLLRSGGLACGRCNQSLATRATAVAVLALVCFQLSRVFLTIPLSWYECPMVKQSGQMSSLASHHHDGSEAAKADLPLSPNDGCSFRCCKGDVDGLAIIPLQAFGIVVTVSHQQLASTWVSRSWQSQPALENYLPPPFQPPKNLI